MARNADMWRGMSANRCGASPFFYRFPAFTHIACQSALDWDPLSASKRDPFERRVRPVALALSELAGVAETVRARVV